MLATIGNGYTEIDAEPDEYLYLMPSGMEKTRLVEKLPRLHCSVSVIRVHKRRIKKIL